MMNTVKILKDGIRTTYILVREKENIPLVTVENGEIRIEKVRLVDYEVAFTLIAALRHAVMKHMKRKDVYRPRPIEKFYWQLEAIEAMEAIRQDDSGISQSQDKE